MFCSDEGACVRFGMPQGTSCSFLQAVTQALHSMQRSASQRNFIRAMVLVFPQAALFWQRVDLCPRAANLCRRHEVSEASFLTTVREVML